MTPLHVAAKKGECIEIVIKLIHNKADINIKDNNGVSDSNYTSSKQCCIHCSLLLLFENFYQPSSFKADGSHLKPATRNNYVFFPVGCIFILDTQTNTNM